MAYNFAQYHDPTRDYATYLRSTLPYHAPRAHRSIIEKSSKSAIPSSTPHAPRNLVNQRGQPVPQKRQYKFLDNSVFKSASAPNLLMNKDEKLTDTVGSISTNQKQQASTKKPPKPLVTEAWTTEDVVNKKVVKVKPYRRETGRKAPVGVPLLDLHKLNEPDSAMEPIELITVSPDSSHTDISWGATHKDSYISDNKHLTTVEVEDAEVVQDNLIAAQSEEELNYPKQVVMDNVPEKDSIVKDISSKPLKRNGDALETPTVPFDSVAMEKIEQQMENDQLGQQMVATPTADKPKPYTQDSKDQKTKIINQHLKPTSLHYYAGVTKDNTGALNKRVKFSVRLITRNGRDIHREMCGFFFVADNSLTIYELRQFGKKLTAIPLVQRGVYKYLKGACKGQEYEVNSVRKGTLLQFDPTGQTSLPVSLLEQKMLCFKITAVDEDTKRRLLLDGIKDLVERRRMEQYLSQPLPDQVQDNTILCTIQAMMKERLNGRAAKTLIGLGRQLAKDKDDITFLQLQLALRQFHIGITPEDLQRFWSLVDPDGVGSVDLMSCMQGLMGEMKEVRKQLVHQLFRKLDVRKAGNIALTDLKTYFNPRLHPEVVAGRKSCDEIRFIALNALDNPQPGSKCYQQTISFAEFEDYFEGVSIDTSSDVDFTKIIKGCWGL